MVQIMIGREKEIKELMRLYNRSKPDFIAIYGRRRVGKTYLVDQTFKGKIVFRHAGLSPLEKDDTNHLRAQLKQFQISLQRSGMNEAKVPENWQEAFFFLEQFLESKAEIGKRVVFLDELPWMDTPGSGFMTALEGFWNNWGCCQDDLKLIVCGSASSWIVDHLINNHGGLYNRITHEIHLSPFNLHETELYLQEQGINYFRYDVVQAYMITGGIPYYLSYFEPGYSISQIADRLFFSEDAKLAYEYDRLFASIFSNHEVMKSIVSLLASKNAGYTRKEIVETLGMKDGGTLSKNLNALIISDFITTYVPYGFNQKQKHYRLKDPFCIFYHHFEEQIKSGKRDYWENANTSHALSSWRGISFENVCFNHIPQIKFALGISGVESQEYSWSKRDDDTEGTQFDLIIDRKDNVLNVCEIKFYSDAFTVDKDYYRTLLHRQTVIVESVSKKHSVQQVLITTFELRQNSYSSIFSKVITLDDLFC